MTKMHPSTDNSQVFKSIVESDVMPMSLVKQCQFLEPKLSTKFTSEVLRQPELSLRDLIKHFVKTGRMKTLEISENHLSLQFALNITRV